MTNRTKLTILIGAVAAVISALVLISRLSGTKLLALCPCRKRWRPMTMTTSCRTMPI